MNHQFNTLRRGIIVRVNYQIENSHTGQILRKMSEDLRIFDREYYLDINGRDINDNALITNFSSTLVSTVNSFTYGMEQMLFRITKVQLFYETLRADVPKAKQLQQCQPYREAWPEGVPYNPIPEYLFSNDKNIWNYHNEHQRVQRIGGPESLTTNGLISPPLMSSFNRFYHFTQSGDNIILHAQEINDPRAQIALLPCGVIHVNRRFVINPGHRIVFRINIFKNDCMIVNDTTEIAKVLQVPFLEDAYDNTDEVVSNINTNVPVVPAASTNKEQDINFEEFDSKIMKLQNGDIQLKNEIDTIKFQLNGIYNAINKLTDLYNNNEILNPPIESEIPETPSEGDTDNSDNSSDNEDDNKETEVPDTSEADNSETTDPTDNTDSNESDKDTESGQEDEDVDTEPTKNDNDSNEDKAVDETSGSEDKDSEDSNQ
jgi:hypothetical protein